jgi:hypothetical protein
MSKMFSLGFRHYFEICNLSFDISFCDEPYEAKFTKESSLRSP